MIINNLSEILGRKRIKKADIEKATGISRPALTALYYGTSKGINFDTLNKLCGFLSVTPGEIFSFYPVDVKGITVAFEEKEKFLFNGPFIEHAGFSGKVDLVKNNVPVCLEFSGRLADEKHDHDYEVSILFNVPRKDYFSLFPDAVAQQIDKEIFNTIESVFSDFDNWAGLGDSVFFFADKK